MAGQEQPVLIIEDDVDAGEVLALLLNTVGCKALLAFTRDEAVKLLADHSPRVVLMDYAMSGMSAEDFVAQVRQVCPEAKIILLTAQLDAHEIADKLRVDACFVKPVDLEPLVEFVNMLRT